MQREEPPAGLVDALGDEVGGVYLPELLPVFERVVHLCVRHGSGVEPDVDQVGFAAHGLALRRDEDDRVDVGAVQVDAVRGVVLLRHVADLEIFIRVVLHHTGLD